MLNIIISLPNGINIHFPETEFMCPECNGYNRFYSISPLSCIKCSKPLPDIRELGKVQKARVDHHFGVYQRS